MIQLSALSFSPSSSPVLFEFPQGRVGPEWLLLAGVRLGDRMRKELVVCAVKSTLHSGLSHCAL
jgi:hypothetical protein